MPPDRLVAESRVTFESSSIDPGIAAADKALLSGTGQQLAKELSTKVSAEIQERYSAALERRKHAGESVAEGRQFVEAYVDYIHFVESVHRIASHGVTHLHHEAEAPIE